MKTITYRFAVGNQKLDVQIHHRGGPNAAAAKAAELVQKVATAKGLPLPYLHSFNQGGGWTYVH